PRTNGVFAAGNRAATGRVVQRPARPFDGRSAAAPEQRRGVRGHSAPRGRTASPNAGVQRATSVSGGSAQLAACGESGAESRPAFSPGGEGQEGTATVVGPVARNRRRRAAEALAGIARRNRTDTGAAADRDFARRGRAGRAPVVAEDAAGARSRSGGAHGA